MGGVAGMVYSAVPVVVFVLANSFWGLTTAIWCAIGSAVLITAIRLIRRESLQPAISGFFGVAIAAFIAYQTGTAKGFFLFGIWQSLVYGAVMVISVVARWPLVGVFWNYVNGAGTRWRKDRRSVRDFDIATMALAIMFAARFVVQRWLYEEDLTGWLAVAKIGMGFPLFGLVLLVIVWAIRRSDNRLAATVEQEERGDAEIEAELRARYGDSPAS
ncbi:MAG: DUF3159 domain-containing protein [Thermocrispum sp.]